MKPLLFFDTETTGLPEWKIPSGDPKQPHLVQLAAILADADTRKVISSFDLIVKPEGWEIPQEMTDIHGISNEKALAVGMPEPVVFEMLIGLWNEHTRVAYNRTFDQRIIRIAAKRFASDAVIEAWANKDDFPCAMIQARKALSAPKNLKLADALEQLTGKKLENAHSAMADTQACMDVYWAILNKEGCDPLT